MKNPLSVPLSVALLLTGAPLDAHHGAASFDTTKELTLKGP